MQFNNIPIRVFWKQWSVDGTKTSVIPTTKANFISKYSNVGRFKANIYKYTENEGRVQLDESYYNNIEVPDIQVFITNKFKQYTKEQGIVLDMEIIV